MEKWDQDDREEIMHNKVFILYAVLKYPMVYSPRLLDATYIGLATYIMESDIVSAEDKEVITDWALENFNEWRDGKWRWTVPPEDRPVDFDYSFIIDLEEDTTNLSDDDNSVKGESIWEEDIQRMIEARDLEEKEKKLAVKVECDEEEEEEECEECNKPLALSAEVFNTQDDFPFCVPDGYYCEVCSKTMLEDE